ncbi:MAG: hypothetical protein KatS3mg060_1638 [Dehalococcoidia bacterium]|nr:MAG: hypothetical protein KatS3mg060_1638 [Dehalococcoidia bacterium]
MPVAYRAPNCSGRGVRFSPVSTTTKSLGGRPRLAQQSYTRPAGFQQALQASFPKAMATTIADLRKGSSMPWNQAAYLFWPPIWVGSAPSDPSQIDVNTLDRTVHSQILKCGVEVFATYEGLFRFDFSRWCDKDDSELRKAMSNYARIYNETNELLVFNPDEMAKWKEAVEHRVRVMNAHLACLYTVIQGVQHLRGIPVKTLSLADICVYLNDKVPHPGTGQASAWYLLQLKRSKLAPGTIATGSADADDCPLPKPLEIGADVIKKSFELLDNLMNPRQSNPSDRQALLYADLILRSVEFIQQHSYSLSLTTSWTLVEHLLGLAFQTYRKSLASDPKQRPPIDDPNGKPVSCDPGKYTVSETVKILRKARKLRPDLAKRVDSSRVKRNRWIHSLAEADFSSASDTLEVAWDLLLDVASIDLRFGPSVSHVF